jgi:hypothetical protein
MSKILKGVRWHKILKEIPVIGEFIKTVLYKSGGRRVIGKVGCCCLPFAVLLIAPIAFVVFLLINAAVGYFGDGFSIESAFQQLDYWLTWLNRLADKIFDLINHFAG